MNAEREDLAEILCEADDYIYGLLTPDEAGHYQNLADAVLAAGYRKPGGTLADDMLANAWDEGFSAGWAECRDPDAFVNDVWDAKTPNPYREAGDE